MTSTKALYSRDEHSVTIGVSHSPLELHSLIAVPIKVRIIKISFQYTFINFYIPIPRGQLLVAFVSATLVGQAIP